MDYSIKYLELCEILWKSGCKKNKKKADVLLNAIKEKTEPFSEKLATEIKRRLRIDFLLQYNRKYKASNMKKDRFLKDSENQTFLQTNFTFSLRTENEGETLSKKGRPRMESSEVSNRLNKDVLMKVYNIFLYMILNLP